MSKHHYHFGPFEYGVSLGHKCWHKCRSTIFTWGFWIGLTMGFPIEHYLWEHIWPFYLITRWLGL